MQPLLQWKSNECYTTFFKKKMTYPKLSVSRAIRSCYCDRQIPVTKLQAFMSVSNLGPNVLFRPLTFHKRIWWFPIIIIRTSFIPRKPFWIFFFFRILSTNIKWRFTADTLYFLYLTQFIKIAFRKSTYSIATSYIMLPPWLSKHYVELRPAFWTSCMQKKCRYQFYYIYSFTFHV